MNNVLDYLRNTEGKYPDKIAFRDTDNTITFSELVINAERIAVSFMKHEVFDRPIAFFISKSCLSIVGLFAAVYAGAFYSFIDDRFPNERIHLVLEALSPALIVTDAKNQDRIKDVSGIEKYHVINIEDLLSSKDGYNVFSSTKPISSIEKEKLKTISKSIISTSPLYINYTSGSTGRPKGVVVSHGNVISFINEFLRVFDISKDDVLANQAPFDFDVSVKDIFSGISTGAEVLLVPRKFFSNPTRLMEYLVDNNVSVIIWAVSAICFVAIMKGLDYKKPDKIRLVLFSGEIMPEKHLRYWYDRLPGVVFGNLYGPTEITCNCTYYLIDENDDLRRIPIGNSFGHNRVFLLDEKGVEISETEKEGEICVSGPNVALGYYHDSEKTNEVFVLNPNNSSYYERVYKTGDRGKRGKDGLLYFLGRKDYQIKHLGHRIELTDIEGTINGIKGVERSVCLHDESKGRLILVFMGDAGIEDVLLYSRNNLPVFMVPNKVYRMDELPMNKNGKIDRKLLYDKFIVS